MTCWQFAQRRLGSVNEHAPHKIRASCRAALAGVAIGLTLADGLGLVPAKSPSRSPAARASSAPRQLAVRLDESAAEL